MTATLLNKFQRLTYKKGERSKNINNQVFGRKLSIITKLFGCRHEDISRPFANGTAIYRSCLQCGARRQFNFNTFETYGNFYFPPVIKE
jgi:hypothetical protein